MCVYTSLYKIYSYGRLVMWPTKDSKCVILQMIQFLWRGTIKVVVYSLCLSQIIFQLWLIRRMPEMYLSDTQTHQQDMDMLMLVRLLHFVTLAIRIALNSSNSKCNSKDHIDRTRMCIAVFSTWEWISTETLGCDGIKN